LIIYSGNYLGKNMKKTLLALALLAASSGAFAAKATAKQADAFVAEFNAQRLKEFPLETAAAWLQATYINDDSQLVSAYFSEQYLGFIGKKVEEAKRFVGVKGLKPETARALTLLKLQTSMPAPANAAKREELAKIAARMDANYGAAKWCKTPESCLDIGGIHRITDDINAAPATRAEAWAGWHATARPIRKDYQRFVELTREGAKEMGFKDLAEQWKAGYDMSPKQFDAETDRLWGQVQPLYKALHCHVRHKLNQKYGDAVVAPNKPIPAHLLGNLWAQEWSNTYPLVEPYAGVSSLDVTGGLKAKGYDAVKMTQLSEDFYVSLGFPKLPESFYKKSQLVQPRDRDVVCHASAWDMNTTGDVRMKMCIEPNEENLTTIHHELGHIYYYLMYNHQPFIFQTGAHDGFHEAIGDTITLSMTPAHMQKIGLVGENKPNPKATINTQMKLALDKIAFLPFGKLIDQWRWQVFTGEIAPNDYNKGWWKLREQYQGIVSPIPVSEENFDAGAKYHVPGNTPYTRYFLSFIIQFQFHKALCDAAGHQGPLHECDIYGNKAAGEKLMAMLKDGASKPWQDSFEKLTGSRQMDASAILEYFQPLMGYLNEQNQGLACGW
jgi:peptidyl-dipeptidase A